MRAERLRWLCAAIRRIDLEDREQFLDAIRIVAGHTGLSEVFIEKDYYITMILKLLSQKLTFLVFKGGTSL